MEIDFAVDGDEKRLEKLGECAVAAHVRFSRETRTACILKEHAAVAYSLTDSTYCSQIMDIMCIDRSVMVRLLEMQLAEIITDKHERLRIYEKYEEYGKIAEIVASIPDFSFEILSEKTRLSCSLRDKTGCTPLMDACRRVQPDLCKKLLDSEFAQVGQISRSGETALYYACYRPIELRSIIQALFDASPSSCGQISRGGRTPLIQLCGTPERETPATIELVKKMLATGKAKPGHIAQDETTALICACMKYKVSTTALLLTSGKSKPRHRTSGGQSAYSYAMKSKPMFLLFAPYRMDLPVEGQ